MNIYLVSQDVEYGYDTYDSFICYAESEEEARTMCPSGHHAWINNQWHICYADGTTAPRLYKRGDWSLPSEVEVELIGKATDDVESGVILASFNAG